MREPQFLHSTKEESIAASKQKQNAENIVIIAIKYAQPRIILLSIAEPKISSSQAVKWPTTDKTAIFQIKATRKYPILPILHSIMIA
jgi:hypothetical protein